MNKKWHGFSDTDQQSNDQYQYPEPLTTEQHQTALTQFNSGVIVNIDGVEITKRGIDSDRYANLAPEKLENVGRFIGSVNQTMQLLVGDMANINSHQKHHTDYIADLTGYKKKSVQNFASVAKAVHFSIRRDNLTFGHYREVAKLSYEEQKHILQVASDHSDEGMTVSQMKAYMRKQRLIEAPAQTTGDWREQLSAMANRELHRAQTMTPDDRAVLAEFHRRLAQEIEAMK